MIIRKGTIDDLMELQQLYVDTIRTVCSADYTPEQIDAWASNVENEQRWLDVLAKQFVLVAQHNEKITGFCTLDNGSYIDLFYVHKDYQGQGIARMLYGEIEKEARQREQNILRSNVSRTARPFFESMGFRVAQEQNVEVKGVMLTNYRMEKIVD